jgi:hypothetical protein
MVHLPRNKKKHKRSNQHEPPKDPELKRKPGKICINNKCYGRDHPDGDLSIINEVGTTRLADDASCLSWCDQHKYTRKNQENSKADEDPFNKQHKKVFARANKAMAFPNGRIN